MIAGRDRQTIDLHGRARSEIGEAGDRTQGVRERIILVAIHGDHILDLDIVQLPAGDFIAGGGGEFDGVVVGAGPAGGNGCPQGVELMVRIHGSLRLALAVDGLDADEGDLAVPHIQVDDHSAGLLQLFHGLHSGGQTGDGVDLAVVQNGLIQRDRIFTVSVLLPDKPGELHRVSGILADLQGNVIKLEHNQFVSVNRSNEVELRITLEAFGTEHKERILKELKRQGYRPILKAPKQIY